MARPKKSSVRLHEPTSHTQRANSIPWRSSCSLSGPITEKFAKENPEISRTIQIRGDQTLEDLHHALFDAFDRSDEHMYEFQFGKGPMDPKAPRGRLAGRL